MGVSTDARRHSYALDCSAIVLLMCTAAFAQTSAEMDSHFAAADAGASVILSNHSEYDGAYTKARLAGVKREVGENPFIVGAAGVQRYFTVMTECAQASKLRFGAKSKRRHSPRWRE